MEKNHTLRIYIKSGDLIRNTEVITEMDPYLEMVYKEQKWRSRVLNEAGMHPVWDINDYFEIVVSDEDKDKEVTFECLEKDVFIDDHVGVGKFKVSEMIKNKILTVDIHYPTYESNKSGLITF